MPLLVGWRVTLRESGGSAVRRWLLTAAGVVSIAVGVAGVFVPLLPTTPFLLLAAACFVRSSDRLYRWLTGHGWLGPYLRNHLERRAITNRARVVVLLLLWGTLAYSAFGATDRLCARLAPLAAGLGVTAHVLRLRTAGRE
ncbi:MAG: YbaN family protein [Gemmatimonadetes bacterium]|nr:YbaN family protein [Gemmatimonadota bacterium]